MRSLLICIILGIGIGLYIQYKEENPTPRHIKNKPERENTLMCDKCEGSGVIPTYGYCTDPASHFHGDCKKETHGESCASSGSKQCTCCGGSGVKRNNY